MAVPDFASFLLPTLEIVKAGGPISRRDAAQQIADRFSLTPEERALLLPSGVTTLVESRTGWAFTYLTKAKLIEKVKRAQYAITDRGLDILKNPPDRITQRFLLQFDEFRAFAISEQADLRDPVKEKESVESETNPLELAELAFLQLKNQTTEELIIRLKEGDPRFFEETVVKVIVAMGYGGSLQDAGKAIGQAGDEGIDGIINEDKLGLDVLYLQAKRWEGSVGRPEIQKFAGALLGKRARKGIFITTSDFTKEARDYVQTIDSKIVLISGRQFAELMWEHNVGVSVSSTYVVKKIDSDFFDD